MIDEDYENLISYTRLVIEHGRLRARELVADKTGRQCVDIVADLLAEEDARLDFSHSGFALTYLPYRDPKGPLHRRDTGSAVLLVESGRDRDGNYVGVPYGSVGRMILLYLQSEAVKHLSPTIELGSTMRQWMTRMGLTTGGMTYRRVTEQASRVSACRLTLFRTFEDTHGKTAQRTNAGFVKNEIVMVDVDPLQPALFQPTVTLTDEFYKDLTAHALPLREDALRKLADKPMAIDLYLWLVYRLRVIGRPTFIPWPLIYKQFGSGFKHLRQMKDTFEKNLRLACAAYPEARVGFDKQQGVTLYPSPPALADRRSGPRQASADSPRPLSSRLSRARAARTNLPTCDVASRELWFVIEESVLETAFCPSEGERQFSMISDRLAGLPRPYSDIDLSAAWEI